ncbi:YtxH domain-containing protein [Pontibacillus sp. HMF3514]|uniref:YtxH domain-containing protein n=1 Tax=Pontibacillus sp. HMF3514 TaxID=2692425 RepID=UPI00131F6C83|nr:YtxH domain-containing protein [Pontibacillus sp. HMF3514]QHE50949.1 hypothetical protein GS400_02330 [Pontibacillus sp. HMF3514]
MTKQQESVNQTTKTISKTGVLTGTIIGSVVGATASLLLAPKGGKELRKDLSQQSKVVLDKSKDLKDRTSEKSKKLLNPCENKDETTGEETNEHELSTMNHDPFPVELSEVPPANLEEEDRK